jgi:putative hydrolase of the HAD superfamily
MRYKDSGILRETLLIDADDTLWENNVYFEEMAEQYFSLMTGLGFTADVVRRTLNEVERKNIQTLGYGAENFVMALKETLLLLAGPSRSTEYFHTIDKAAAVILNHPIELLEGVADCLEHLSGRHRTILFTKGNPKEQTRKIEASGLARFFSAIEIVREKDQKSFCGLLRRYQLVKELTWMVGNSPKSDINPAIAVGINAIYIPHPRTWELEKESLACPEKVTVLQSFSALTDHFETRLRERIPHRA